MPPVTEEASPPLVGYARAQVHEGYVFGRGYFDPALPHHNTPRRCPFWGAAHRIHAGFADHRDRCEEGSSRGSNPAGPADGSEEA